MSMVAHRTIRINPTLTALATAFTVSHADDPAALRACQRAMDHLANGPVLEFDGVELRVTSRSRGHGCVHVATTDSCSCEGNKHPWCLHRVEAVLLTAEWALTQPAFLRAKIVEQTEPVAMMSDDAYVAACDAVDELF